MPLATHHVGSVIYYPGYWVVHMIEGQNPILNYMEMEMEMDMEMNMEMEMERDMEMEMEMNM